MNDVPGQRGPGASDRQRADGEREESLTGLMHRRVAESSLPADAKQLLAEAFATGTPATPASAKQRVYLDEVKVTGFRGIGQEARLTLPPTSGVTLVVGRNGSGKSSFAEALEVAFTGRNRGWSGTSGGDVARREHWRNLHHGAKPSVEVSMHIGGDAGRSRLTRTWPGESVESSEVTFRRSGDGRATYDGLGWNGPLDDYRPFLTYSELGDVIAGKPSQMYDAVASILGLGRLAEANNRLAGMESELKGVGEAAKREIPELRKLLETLDDPRKQSALDALEAEGSARIEQVAALVTGLPSADAAELARLRKVAELRGPDLQAVGAAVDGLREAAAVFDDVRASVAEDAHQRAELLDQALRHAARHPDDPDCPVCGTEGRLDDGWTERATAQLAALHAEARSARAVRDALSRAVDEVRHLISPVPHDCPDEVREVWRAWVSCRGLTDPRQLAEAAEDSVVVLADACHSVRENAARQLERLDERWRQVVARLAAWLEVLRRAATGADRLKAVRAARRWLKSVTEELRAQRLEPFAERSQWIWRQLGQDSNVTLHGLELKGTNKANTRKLLLEASVDDMEASALGVMSQGELYSLALSLFLPRAAATDSPFGFLVIDDPVQSMDPAKVHGLARVLAALGKDRQVIVFTHDTRLQQAFTDQQLPVTVREVCRGKESRVKVRPVCDPVGQAVKDARALALTPGLSREALAHVLPGLCRTVLEYAFVEAARRRLHRDGVSPHGLDTMVEGARTLREKAALALFGDAERATREVCAELRRRWGGEAVETFGTCNQGAHGTAPLLPQSAKRLVQQAENLAGKVRTP